MQSFSRAMILIGCSAIASNLYAQNIDVISTSPIHVVSSNELERTIRIGDIEEILRFTPNHVLKERSSVDLKNPNRATLLLVDVQRVPSYTRMGDAPDINIIPASLVDKVEIIKDGASTVYGSDAIAGVTNFIIRTNANLDGLQNSQEASWAKAVADILGKPNTSLSLDDNTFNNGKVTLNINPQGNFVFENRVYFDEQGKMRIRINRQYTQEGTMFEIKDYFDCSGSQVHKQAVYTEPFGYTFPLYDIPYLNGQPQIGYRDIAPGDAYIKYRQPFNLITGTIDWNAKPGIWQNYKFAKPEPCSTQDGNNNNNMEDDDLMFAYMLFFGLSYMMEDTDGVNPFCMFGPGFNFTHMLNNRLGVGLDAAYYMGKQYGWDNSRLNLMAGVEYYPFNSMSIVNPFSIAPFIYLGLSRHAQKYMNYKNSLSSFAALAGINFAYKLSQRLRLKASGAVNPIFIENNTAINGRLDLGVRFSF